jgi:hypothetical protein
LELYVHQRTLLERPACDVAIEELTLAYERLEPE